MRRNALYYDVMCFEWRWAVSKLELANYMSDDVIETVKGKIKEHQNEIQNMLTVIAYIPNTLKVSNLNVLIEKEGFLKEEVATGKLVG